MSLSRLDPELISRYESMSDADKQAISVILKEMEEHGNSSILESFKQDIYRWEPVGIEEFLDSEEYLGKFTGELFPKWREVLIEIFQPDSKCYELVLGGAIGVGKCESEDSCVLTGQGLKTQKECHLDKQKSVRTHKGRIQSTYHHYDIGKKKTLKIKTRLGYETESSKDHKYKILKGTDFVWKKASEIRKGDVMVMEAGGYPDIKRSRLTPDQAEFLGIWTGDGHSLSSGSMAITVGSKDKESRYLPHVIAMAESMGKVHVRRNDNYTVFVTSRDLWRKLKLDGFKKGAKNKDIPKVIRTSPRTHICRFFRGLFDTDGTIYEGNRVIEFTTCSPKLAQQAQSLLLTLGIVTSRTFKKNDHLGAWTVRIVGDSSHQIFKRDIGFSNPSKKDKLETRNKNNKTWRKNDYDRLYGLRETLAEARECFEDGYRKCNKNLFGGLRQHSIQRDSLDRWLSVPNRRPFPEILHEIQSRNLQLLPVESIEESEAYCYDLAVENDESYISNGFLSHNSSITAIGMTRVIYEMSCLRDPHTYYGLMKGSMIVFGIYSLTKSQAKDSIFAKVKKFVKESPYFARKMPFVDDFTTRIEWKGHGMSVITGSKGFHAIGLDMFSFALDEGNFFRSNKNKGEDYSSDTNQAQIIYNGSLNRLKSRFMQSGGRVPGMVFLASSKTSKGAFMEEHVRKHQNEIKTGEMKLCEFSQWEVRDPSKYTKRKFRVEVGDRLHPPRVVPWGETPREGAEVILVPGEYKDEFERDCEGALRDIAGLATFGLSPFLRDKTMLHQLIDSEREHPFLRDSFVIDIGDDIEINEYFIPNRLFNVVMSSYTPLRHPGMGRFLHIDIGLTGDCAGIAMTHVSHMQSVKRTRGDGTFYEDIVPFVEVDFMLRIVPPKNSEIDLAKIRSFILSLNDMGMPILRVTLDGYQSRDTSQILNKAGIETSLYSVDRNDDAYMTLRQAITESRISYYHYEPFLVEMENLERDASKRKVDHPDKNPDGTKGSKDVSDAVAATVFHCITDPRVNKGETTLLDGKPKVTGRAIDAGGKQVKWGSLEKEFNRLTRG